MTAAIDITKEQRKTLLELLRRFIPGVAVWAYGSRVKWTARPNSDLDLVAFTTPAQRPLVAELKEALAESDLPFLVDFHVWDEVPERFHEIIRKEYVVLQDAEESRGGWEVAGDYPITRVGDLADSISETHKMQKEHLIFLNTSDILHGKFLHHTYSAVKNWPGQAKKSIRKDDILFSEIRPANGRWAFVEKEADDYVVSTKLMVIRARKDRVFPKFLYQYLTSTKISSWLQHLAESRSGTFPQITFDEVASLELPLPPLPEQKAIAHILGTLDDKIELNRRMNATLEAMARALFQSWFVDFDPVRAKLDSRQPAGLDAATAALFPAHFQESTLGHIPQGWEVCPLADKIELLSGGTPKTGEPDYWDGDIPWFSVKDAPTETDVWVIHTEKSVTEIGISNSAAQIFPEKTTIITARGTVGKLALTGIPMAMNQSCYGVRGITGYGDYFTYYSLRAATAQLQQRTHGTVFDTITRQTFETLDCIFPPPKITAAFDLAVEPLLEQIRSNLHQSHNLATLRDTLLPKLLSGELSVPPNLTKLAAVA